MSRRWFPLAILIASAASGLAGAAFHESTERERERARFERAARHAEGWLQRRMDAYMSMLHGVAGLFAAHPDVDDRAFERYLQGVQLERRYPGSRAVGLLAALPAYAIPSRFEVALAAPGSAANRALAGRDLGQDGAIRAAIQRACERGEATLSGKLPALPSAGGGAPGFFALVPIYRDAAGRPNRRCEGVRGLAFGAYSASALMASAFEGGAPPPVAIRLYDGIRAEPEALLHDSGLAVPPRALRSVAQIEVAGQVWTVESLSLSPRHLLSPFSIAVLLLSVGAGALLALFSHRLLRAGEAHRELFQVHPQPMWVFDLETTAFLAVNDAAVRDYGYSVDEFLSMRLTDLHPPQQRRAVTIDRQRASAPGAESWQHRKRDGTVIDVEVDWHRVRFKGREAKIVVARDVTARKRAEAERAHMQAQMVLADRVASIGTLAAGAAHELNNPLAYVVANVEFALEELASTASSEVVQALADAREGAERMKLIVRDLKAYSRAGEDLRRPIDLRAVLESSVKMAALRIGQRARVVTEFAEVPPVVASEARLQQVFLNLLVNAAEAIGDVDGDHHEIRLRLSARGRSVLADVEDTGAGIPDGILPRIFDPFFTTKPVGVGTGLGLWVCHGIVTAHGGKIEVQSEAGKGTRFRVILPAA